MFMLIIRNVYAVSYTHLAYSNDIKIKYYVRADVEQKGMVVCNPKYLMNISKGENMEVIISTDKDNVIEMKIGTYKQKWQGTVAENYPKISMPECNNCLLYTSYSTCDGLLSTLGVR